MTATNALRFLATALLLTVGGAAAAQAPVKIGLIGEFTGPNLLEFKIRFTST